MASDEKIHIKYNFASELTSQITVDNVTYIVSTEEKGGNHSKAFSRVYLDGKIVFSKDADYSHLKGAQDFPDKLKDLMEKLHRSVIVQFTSDIRNKEKKKVDYLEEAKRFLENGKGNEAMTVLQQGLERFPSDPFLLSFYGYLRSSVAKKHEEGIKICNNAIRQLKIAFPYGSECFYPAFYLNLGRAYLGAKKKREAIKAFNNGLLADAEDRALKRELEKLGVRRKPPLPFLKRNSSINRYIGLLLSNPPDKKKGYT